MTIDHDDELDPDDGPIPQASILIVDDVPANLLALEAVLAPLGHRIVKASSGAEALRRVLEEDFALILMDVMMPELDGYQTVALIKKRPRSVDVPIIFITAIASEAHAISKGYEYGAVDYLTKPLDAEILRSKVSVLVALHLQAERIVRQREQLIARRQELQRRAAAKDALDLQNRIKDQFLAAVSHELRTPLNAIMGWADLLAKGNLDQERTRRALDAIQRNANMQKQLVDDLLDLARMVTGKFRLEVGPVSLVRVANAALDTVRPEAEHKGVALEAELDPMADAAVGDPNRLQQAICNLLTNAIKFTPTGGTVRVSLRRHGPMAEIEVTDTGVGIQPEHLPYVFDRLWQVEPAEGARHPGLGLGLAIVRQLMELHGGAAHARSAGLGKGATFVLTLPHGELARIDEAS